MKAEGGLAAPDLRRRGLPHPLDVAACAERGHGINIKLAKSGRDPRSDPDGARGPRARPGRDARLHGRVGPGYRRGAAVASLCDHVDLDGNILVAEDPWPGASGSSTASSSHRRLPALASAKEYVVLAEGKSGNEHYGRTMRGASSTTHLTPSSQFSTRTGRGGYRGVRSSPPSASARLRADHGDRRRRRPRATASARLAPLKDSIRAGLDLESGLHEFISDDAELSGLARKHGVELQRDLPEAAARAQRPPRAKTSGRPRSSSPSAPTARSRKKPSPSSSTSPPGSVA